MNALPFPPTHARFLGAALGSLLTLGGCANATRFDVAFAQAPGISASGASYRLVCENAELSPDDPPVRDTVQRVKLALADKGRFEAAKGERADVEIELIFGLGPPQRRLVASVDHLNQPPPWPTNHVFAPDPAADDRPVIRNSEGYLVTLSPTIVRLKFLRLAARETPETAGANPPREFWSVSVSKEDESPALDAYLPSMVAAAAKSIPPGISPSRASFTQVADHRLGKL